jgi:succinate dehydrogenase / fumarate reductase flavoprotein subunit
MSESLRNDGRIWVPKKQGDNRPPGQIPEDERDYYLERKYPSFGNLSPRDIASRSAKEACDDGRGVLVRAGAVSIWISPMPSAGLARKPSVLVMVIYSICISKLQGENPYKVPMRIYPAPHYTMGGLWVDYNLMSTIPGLACFGRSELLGSWRKSFGRKCTHAGSGRWLLCYSLHYWWIFG